MTVSVPGASNQRLEPRRVKAGFPRSARLLRHADFERVYKQGRRHFSASLTFFYLQRNPGESPSGTSVSDLRIGFTVGRTLGGAVHRNRMRRRLREAVRLTRPVPGPSADVVINPKKLVLTIAFEALLNEMRQAFVVIQKKLGAVSGASNVTNRKDSGSRTPESGSR